MQDACHKWKVIVTDYSYADLLFEQDRLAQWGAVLVPAQCTTTDEVIKIGKDADALISQYAPITAEVIANLSRCKAIGRYGIGVDNIDVDAATKKEIAVVNVPSYCEDEVSDHALAMLLAWARRIAHYATESREGRWEWKTGRPIHRLQEQVLGLLGFGKIARVLSRKAKAIGLEVIAYDPYLPPETFDQEGVTCASWNELLSHSDFLSLHAPLTPKTHHLISRPALAKMKPRACLINTSRGALVDGVALAEALHSGQLAGACLDVLEVEPPNEDEGNPLLSMDQVLLSPHVAWYSEEAQTELRCKLAEDIGRALNGIRPDGLLNRELAERFRAP